MPTEITDEIATKIRNLVSKGLVAGSGTKWLYLLENHKQSPK
jgi:hypothetical protein